MISGPAGGTAVTARGSGASKPPHPRSKVTLVCAGQRTCGATPVPCRLRALLPRNRSAPYSAATCDAAMNCDTHFAAALLRERLLQPLERHRDLLRRLVVVGL